LPDGQISWLFRAAVQSRIIKYSAFPVGQIIFRSLGRPALLKRGASRSSRTLARDAVDALASSDERCQPRTAKACGPDIPTQISSLRETTRGRRSQQSPVSGENTKKTVNHRAGNAGLSWLTCGDLSSYAFLICIRGYGCGRRARHSPRPLALGLTDLQTPGALCACGNAEVCLRYRGLSRRGFGQVAAGRTAIMRSPRRSAAACKARSRFTFEQPCPC
jgi:hypothetical protein